uniref:ATP synthase complex subunit 8 n=1 Tax=Quadristernoseta cf. intermedia XFX-2019 TaxID=2695871 RepID=A0A6B9WDU2_9ACAR|nr:ATP synthase subunit 8 [Quadristernoseta cf. intermedia XFX-2019]
MPQMNPMNWYFISFFMFSTFTILSSLIYFSYSPLFYHSTKKKSNINFMLYTW